MDFSKFEEQDFESDARLKSVCSPLQIQDTTYQKH